MTNRPQAQWRSLNPAPQNPHALQPAQMGGVNRREFFSLMGASLALAGAAGCTAKATLPEKIVPYVKPPEEMLPGKPLHFATAMPHAGYGIGLIVKSHEGRPIKIEGNPDHPASMGATDAFAQASLLTLYDPDRAQSVTRQGAISTTDAFLTALSAELQKFKNNGGAGLAFLSGAVGSPSEGELLNEILQQFPNARWHQYEPVNNDSLRAGQRLAFGRYLDPVYNLQRADVILSLDADFLYWGPGRLHYIREFADRRAVEPGDGRMNRLYVFETLPSITGAKADHRVPMRPADIERLAFAIAARLGIESTGAQSFESDWFDPMMRDLDAHRGSSLILAGLEQPPHIHALVHAINEKLGNNGQTVQYVEPAEVNPVEHTQSLRSLVQTMQAGQIDTLVMLDVNPVYATPADLAFSDALRKVRLKVSHSMYYDETAAECDWHIPSSHFLESWSDVRSYDGSATIVQPLIVPLYKTKSVHEFLCMFLGRSERSNYEIVREFWSGRYSGANFEDFWEQSLQQGVVRDAQFAPKPVNATVQPLPAGSIPPDAQNDSGAFQVVVRPDPSLYDGRFANNGWLQELPDPLTKLTWDNAVMISPQTASKLQAYDEDLVDLQVNGRQITGAIWVVPGLAPDAVAVRLGWGRKRAGRVGTERGFSAYELRSSDNPWRLNGGQIRKRNQKYSLVSTQNHHETEDRHMVRHLSQDEYARNPNAIQTKTPVPSAGETLYPAFENIDYAWGMSVDMSRCVGCNACVVACQAENNGPVVGKNEVARGREMQWLRIDSYFEGERDNPEMFFQPMFCQHCETAPCEYVCPVEATTHSAEGINEMTYNRCIGTRYCSNNCPYKVRRFNFFQYAVWDIPSLKLLYNPDVTVRSRGVMEKCTYCIQRVNRARIEAMKQDRKIRDGELVTACQQACPANAFVFGNLLDKESNVSKKKAEPRDYGVLADYNTRPRTTYLAVLKNPNPDITGLETVRRNNG